MSARERMSTPEKKTPQKKDDGPAPRQTTDLLRRLRCMSNRQIETYPARLARSRRSISLQAWNSNTTGGSRNEQNIYVRGFDRWQVPLTIDGVRVYLPADKQARFRALPDARHRLRADRQGHLSNGRPRRHGRTSGSPHIASRHREIEGEMRTGLEFGRDGTYEGIKTYGPHRNEAGELLSPGERRLA